MTRLPIVLLVAAAYLAACRTHPDWCEGALDNRCSNIDAPTPRCTGDEQCSAPTAVCDLAGSMVCVQCVAPDQPEQVSACSRMTPVCEDQTCRACQAHSECGSNVCLTDGTCASESDVADVAQSGSGSACTKTSPCGTLGAGIETNRPIVKIATGLVKDTVVTVIKGKAVTIYADPDAKLDRDGDGPIIEVYGAGADVRIIGLEITGATNPGGDAIVVRSSGGMPKLTITKAWLVGNQGMGLTATDSAITVSQSTISGNKGGGVSVFNGAFVIVGNVFSNNGNDMTRVGGVSVDVPQNTANRLELNSFNRNKTRDGTGSAIHCEAGTFAAKNNIMSENGTVTNVNQVSGMCEHTYSIVRPGPLPAGTGNSADDPKFTDTATGDLHIMTGSPAHDAADPASDLSGVAEHDRDGNKRISPADIGAYELP
jgi:hypothetical protein